MLRPDGATRADRAEASALVVAALVLLMMPVFAALDRLSPVWFGVTLAAAAGGVFIGALGVRWFLVEGPPLVAQNADGHPALASYRAVELPAGVRLVEARSRLGAHAVRFAALGSAVLLFVVEVGDFKWVAVGLIALSFVADHTMLRPQRFVLDEEGLSPDGMMARGRCGWDDVVALYWRHYPGEARPPFPSGERVVVERTEGEDLEFVFHRKYGGTAAAELVATLQPLLGDRVRLLLPRTEERVEIKSADVSEIVDREEHA